MALSALAALLNLDREIAVQIAVSVMEQSDVVIDLRR
jgi:hypothetical protein